ncbi:sodium:calcium antiporter [Alienimonas chondri]|uniref:Sodium/calcium exchanger membrane region domain-containing protein n=1 Tax=Alienimonas chondri TaxID=2681879 RepID=A0ABX1VBM8_9PLAN|nr:sodium:calcium antiporter [Alienimonas chondri]NNJ25335.1 hypothetical protein [Alienimonas chondri]
MLNFDLPLPANLGLFAAAAAVIGFAGVRASKYADRIADRTGLGEALTGTFLLGFLTALPGLTASVVAALNGRPTLAIANAMGGIAAQTAALAVADFAYRKANLEHAAASLPNMMQAAMLSLLLTLVLLGLTGPDVTVANIHPVTLLSFAAAVGAFLLVVRIRRHPMWKPRQTEETVQDEPEPEYEEASLRGLIVKLVLTAGLTGACGAVVAEAAGSLVEQTGVSEAVVGGLLLALATSLPELVTSVAAVRRGAVTLAVSDIVGGNFFDVLFVAAADLAFLQGSIYHGAGVGPREAFMTGLAILLNLILLAGMIARQREGPANIGLESAAMLLCYGGGFLTLALWM